MAIKINKSQYPLIGAALGFAFRDVLGALVGGVLGYLIGKASKGTTLTPAASQTIANKAAAQKLPAAQQAQAVKAAQQAADNGVPWGTILSAAEQGLPTLLKLAQGLISSIPGANDTLQVPDSPLAATAGAISYDWSNQGDPSVASSWYDASSGGVPDWGTGVGDTSTDLGPTTTDWTNLF